MLHPLTALGILVVLAGGMRPMVPDFAVTAWAIPVAPAAATSPAVSAAQAEAERPRESAQMSRGNLDSTSRLMAAKQQLEEAERAIQQALVAALEAERIAEQAVRDAASSRYGGKEIRDRLIRASDLIAQLREMQAQVEQSKKQVNDLISSSSASKVTSSTGKVPDNLAASVEQVEVLARQASANADKANALASHLQEFAPPTAAPPKEIHHERKVQGPPPSPPPPAPGPSRSPASEEPSPSPSLEVQVEKWFDQLNQGSLRYKVPNTMYWKESSTVTVVIEGPRAPASSALPDATGSGAVKVSDRMRVVVSCPDNPDEFTIETEKGTDEIQFVPGNSTTTWNWSVTPKYTGPSQKLSIAAWVLYPGQDDKILEQLPVYTAKIDVHVPGIGDSLKRLIEGDPDYWLRYGLPGGGGFVFVAGALAGLRKWFSKRRAKREKALASSSP